MSEANELEIYVELEKVKRQRDELLEVCKVMRRGYEALIEFSAFPTRYYDDEAQKMIDIADEVIAKYEG